MLEYKTTTPEFTQNGNGPGDGSALAGSGVCVAAVRQRSGVRTPPSAEDIALMVRHCRPQDESDDSAYQTTCE